VLFILYNAKSAKTQKQREIVEEFIKNYLYKAESILKIHLYLLDFGTCVAFTVSFENSRWSVSSMCFILQ
jgi:hypothetical protein